MIRLMDSATVKRGRLEEFPSDIHVLALKAIASGAENRRQVTLALGLDSHTHVSRVVNRLAKAGYIEAIHGAAIEGQHPLTTVLQITPEGAAFLARSSRPKKCDDE